MHLESIDAAIEINTQPVCLTEPVEQVTSSYNLDHPQNERFSRLKKAGSLIAKTAFLGACVVTGINTFTQTETQSGPLVFEAELDINPFDWSGDSALVVPLAGSAEIDTHDGPVHLTATPVAVRDGVRQTVSEITDDPEDTLRGYRYSIAEDIESTKEDLIRKGALAGAGSLAVGLGALAVWDRRKSGLYTPLESFKKTAIPLAMLGLAGVSTIVATTNTVNQDPFSNINYTGELNQAVFIKDAIRDLTNNFDQRTLQIADAMTYLSSLGNSLGNTLLIPSDTTNVLFQSDQHCDPATGELTQRTVEDWNIDFILNGADHVDLGTEPENACVRWMENIGVQVVTVRGNHDRDTTMQALAAMSNVTVLQEGSEITEIEGLTIVGNSDPRSIDSPELDSDFADRPLLYQYSELARVVHLSPEQPDIALIHAPSETYSDLFLDGNVPYVLSGHRHDFENNTNEGTLHITTGSVGGGGLRAFDASPDNNQEATPRTAMILMFDQETNVLKRVVYINYGAIDENFQSIQMCNVVNQEIEC